MINARKSYQWGRRADWFSRCEAYGSRPAAAVLAAALVLVMIGRDAAAETTFRPDRFAGYETVVSDTHRASLETRQRALREVISKDSSWPGGALGETLWTLSALYLNEKVDDANARLLKRARDYIALFKESAPASELTPEQKEDTPWGALSKAEYTRILCLFHAKSSHFPGRLTPETEAAMKEALWHWISRECRMASTGPDDLFLLLGTENHDLTKRPDMYLVLALLQDDPAYKDRRLADGYTIAEHVAAYTAFFREWPRQRAMTGLWVEIGSTTYQKYSWPALFNLHELAPDNLIRKRFGQLLDIALIEEEQISVKGRRGGGRSRAEYGPGDFESLKNLLYAPEGQRAGGGHSRIIETSRYQLPPEAILLRYRAFPPEKPFVIRNRVLGELETADSAETEGQRLAADSALVNYAYRTPHYLLGSTFQNPALAMPDPGTGAPTLKYAGISRQKRACGLLFDDPSSGKISQIHPVVEHIGGGRPQHSFWSIQHENVLIIQRIAKFGRSTIGSYNTGKLGMRFEGADLTKTEENGWIFVTNGKAFAGIKFLDGPHQWDEKREEAYPADFAGSGDTARILLHAGDVEAYGSFEAFRAKVLANPLKIEGDQVLYQSAQDGPHLECFRYDAAAHEQFKLPRIDGKTIDLRPEWTYSGPYLNGRFGDDRVTVTVGPVQKVYDFGKMD